MTQVRDQETVKYDRSSMKILSGLEPVKSRPGLFMECANPVLACKDSVEVLRAIVAFEDVLLMSFRHFKVKLAVVLRRLRRYKLSLSARADLVLKAIHSISRNATPACKDMLAKCHRYLMLTAQHDDEKRACGAAGLSAL